MKVRGCSALNRSLTLLLSLTKDEAPGDVHRSRAQGGTVVPNTLDRPLPTDWGSLPALFHPAGLALFVKGGDAFARFVRLTRLHVVFQREIDVSLHGPPPKFFH